jgi:hypothetical protein
MHHCDVLRAWGERAVGGANATDFPRPHSSGRLQVVAFPIQGEFVVGAGWEYARQRPGGPSTPYPVRAEYWRFEYCELPVESGGCTNKPPPKSI